VPGLSLIPWLRRPRVAHLINRVGLVSLLQRVFAEHRIDCVVDVGANVGQYVRFLRRHVGYRGKIISFEPGAEAYRELTKLAAADDRWEVRHLALGDREGEAQLNVMVGSDLSSLYAPSVADTREFHDINVVKNVETVPLRRLDREIAESEGRLFVKIDTQGHDLVVLDGASGLRDRIVACQIEIPCLNLYASTPGIVECLKYMGTVMEFDLCGLCPVSTVSHQRVVDFDGIFVNRALTK
jgi:FkbM family methyltransferase